MPDRAPWIGQRYASFADPLRRGEAASFLGCSYRMRGLAASAIIGSVLGEPARVAERPSRRSAWTGL
jgi:hypothetical protein